MVAHWLDKETYSKSVLNSLDSCNIPTEMLFCPDIRASAIRLYCTMKCNANFKEGLGVYFPEMHGMCVSQKTLAAMTGLNTNTVCTALKALMRARFIDISHIEDQGHKISFFQITEGEIKNNLLVQDNNIYDIKMLRLVRKQEQEREIENKKTK